MTAKTVTEAKVEYKSDISGQTATEVRVLTEGGRTATLDLTEREATAFDNFVAKYMSKAHDVVIEPSMLREWAVANGHKVGARGRLHPSIQEAYVASLAVADTETDSAD